MYVLKLRFQIIQRWLRPVRREEWQLTWNCSPKQKLNGLNLSRVVALEPPYTHISKEEKVQEVTIEPSAKVKKTLLVVGSCVRLYEIPKQLYFRFHCTSTKHHNQAFENEDVDITILN